MLHYNSPLCFLGDFTVVSLDACLHARTIVFQCFTVVLTVIMERRRYSETYLSLCPGNASTA